MLAGLAEATGLDAHVLTDMAAPARPHLRRLVAELPLSLRSLVEETAAVVGDAVLSSRT